MVVKLCEGCIKDLKEYNPYVEPEKLKIIKIKNIKDCDNYNVDDWNKKFGGQNDTENAK